MIHNSKHSNKQVDYKASFVDHVLSFLFLSLVLLSCLLQAIVVVRHTASPPLTLGENWNSQQP